MGRLGVGIPPVLDTVSSSCLHNFILARLVLSIVHDILALYCKDQELSTIGMSLIQK